jgi:hypothetical protein
MTYIVLYLRHHEKIISGRIHFPGEYCFISLSRKFVFDNGDRYSDKTIQYIKTSGISLFTKSNKSRSEANDTRSKNGAHGKTFRKPNKGTKRTCKKIGCSIKHTCRKHLLYIPQKKAKEWVKNLYRRMLSFYTILTDWHQKSSSMFIKFLFQKIFQPEKNLFRTIHLFKNKTNPYHANSSNICPCFF